MKDYVLKKISFDDYPILLDWANDPITRSSSFNTDIIDVEEHKEFIKSVIEDKNKNQFIFYIDNQPLGTIREKRLSNNNLELSYTVSPKNRNKNIGSKMMMKYLDGKKGIFICRIKKNNPASMKMVIKCGFKLWKQENDTAYYILKLMNE